MRALALDAYGPSPSLRLASLPQPVAGRGEVLVRIAAAPVNPSDLAFLQGRYGLRKRLPVVPGFEGSGVVVETGAGAEALRGARVALAAGEADGTWAEYAVARARHCIPLTDALDIEAAASLVVNPMSAWALLAVAAAGGHPAAINTAAAGGVIPSSTSSAARRRSLLSTRSAPSTSSIPAPMPSRRSSRRSRAVSRPRSRSTRSAAP